MQPLLDHGLQSSIPTIHTGGFEDDYAVVYLHSRYPCAGDSPFHLQILGLLLLTFGVSQGGAPPEEPLGWRLCITRWLC